MAYIPAQLEVGDQIYNTFFGMGVVEKVFRDKTPEVMHIEYKRGCGLIHVGAELSGLVRKKHFWQMQDAALKGRTPTHFVETHQYNLRTHKMTSYVKPAYLTPSGRLRFSVSGDPIKHGIAVSSLNQVRFVNPDLLTLYVFRDDPTKEKHKTSLWKSIAQQLSKRIK